jgi:hypothetical protein
MARRHASKEMGSLTAPQLAWEESPASTVNRGFFPVVTASSREDESRGDFLGGSGEITT